MSVNLSEKFTKSDLLKLPYRDWDKGDEEKWYDALLIVPTRLKHDSGWARIAVIGVTVEGRGAGVAEGILALPDDLGMPILEDGDLRLPQIRCDAFHQQGILRMWSYGHQFQVDGPHSSAQILTRRKFR